MYVQPFSKIFYCDFHFDDSMFKIGAKHLRLSINIHQDRMKFNVIETKSESNLDGILWCLKYDLTSIDDTLKILSMILILSVERLIFKYV